MNSGTTVDVDALSLVSETGTMCSEMADKARDELLKLKTQTHDLLMEKINLELEIKRLESVLSSLSHTVNEQKNFHQQMDLYKQKLNQLEHANKTLREELDYKDENLMALETENRQILDIFRFPNEDGYSKYWAYTSSCTIL